MEIMMNTQQNKANKAYEARFNAKNAIYQLTQIDFETLDKPTYDGYAYNLFQNLECEWTGPNEEYISLGDFLVEGTSDGIKVTLTNEGIDELVGCFKDMSLATAAIIDKQCMAIHDCTLRELTF